MAKIKNLEKWIEQCDECINNSSRVDEYLELIRRIQSVYGCEIVDFENGLNFFKDDASDEELNEGLYDDLETVREKLVNYKNNLKIERQLLKDRLETARREAEERRELGKVEINVSNTNTIDNSLKISIELDKAIKRVNSLPEESISLEEKSRLEDTLSRVEKMSAASKKEETKQKIMDIVKILFDKGVDVLIAVLPYLGKLAQKL